MKKALYIIVLIMLMLLSSCYAPSKKNSVSYNSRKDLLVLFKYCVPFVTDGNEPIGDIEIYPIEADGFGRTLGIMQFNPEHRNCLFGENAIYCILQSGSGQESYFYEDVCCVAVENGKDASAAVEQLKRSNDWNKPLALNKCRRIPIKYYSPSGAYDDSFDLAICEDIAETAAGWESESDWIDVLCKDGRGLWLFTFTKDAQEINSPVMLIMMQEDPSVSPTMFVVGTYLIENHNAPWIEIHAFKENMGWQFEIDNE